MLEDERRSGDRGRCCGLGRDKADLGVRCCCLFPEGDPGRAGAFLRGDTAADRTGLTTNESCPNDGDCSESVDGAVACVLVEKVRSVGLEGS